MSAPDTHEQGHPMVHTRHEDPAGLKVSREIPLPWLVGIIAGVFMQAALMYYQLNAMVEAQTKTTVEIKELRATLNTKDLKDLEHDIKIADLQTRMNAIELRLQGLKP